MGTARWEQGKAPTRHGRRAVITRTTIRSTAPGPLNEGPGPWALPLGQGPDDIAAGIPGAAVRDI
ncbi:hypothetical protein GCM10023259_103570 [Thermocatellispora tengchongensis]